MYVSFVYLLLTQINAGDQSVTDIRKVSPDWAKSKALDCMRVIRQVSIPVVGQSRDPVHYVSVLFYVTAVRYAGSITGTLHEQSFACACRPLYNHLSAWRLWVFRAALPLVNERQAQANDCPCRVPVRYTSAYATDTRCSTIWIVCDRVWFCWRAGTFNKYILVTKLTLLIRISYFSPSQFYHMSVQLLKCTVVSGIVALT